MCARVRELVRPHFFRSLLRCAGRMAQVPAAEEHCLFAFDVLDAHYKKVAPPPPPFATDVACPLFVTWNKQVGRQLQLRGCIGCLKPLALSSIGDYALTSALRDRRFAPIDVNELCSLHCTVQLLSEFEPCALFDWQIGVHGITVSFVDAAAVQRSAVYLPDVIPEQGWTQTEALDSLIRKSGCQQHITDELRASLQVERFTSTKFSVAYDKWAALRSQATTARAFG